MSVTHLHPPTEEQTKAFQAFIDKVYENWDDLDDCRLSIPGEGMWGKLLPEYTPPGGDPVSLVGVNNMPLDGRFQWQDIHRGTGGTLSPKGVVHRRWNTKIWFEYPNIDDEEADLQRRKEILDALKPLGHPGFFSAGFGYVLMTTDDHEQAAEQVEKTLGDKGSLYVSSDDEDDEDA